MKRLFNLITKYKKALTVALVLLVVPKPAFALLPLLGIAATVAAGASWLAFGAASVFVGILGAMAWVTGTAGTMLNLAVNELVVKMGTNFNAFFGVTVNNGWEFIRDMFNMALIFAIIYAGFRVILDSQSAQARKVIVGVVIAALFVNFSLFATKLATDVSNAVATEVYNAVNITAELDDGSIDSSALGISGVFMIQMGLTDILVGGSGSKNLTDVMRSSEYSGFAFFIAAFIFLGMAAFVFFMGAVLLLTRFVGLIFVMIFSPMLFIGLVFPQVPVLANFSRTLFRFFVGQLLVAPIYLILLYISALAVQGASSFSFLGKGAGSLFDAAASDFDSAGSMFVLLIACGFLYGSYKISKSTSEQLGGAMAKSFNNGASKALGMAKFATGATVLGGAAAGLRGTVGARAYATTKDRRVQAAAARGDRGALRKLRKAEAVSKKSFDARQVKAPVLNKSLSDVGFGDGYKGGYDGNLKELEKKDGADLKLISEDKAAIKNAEQAAKGDNAVTKSALERREQQLQDQLQPLRNELNTYARIATDTSLSDAQRQQASINLERVKNQITQVEQAAKPGISAAKERVASVKESGAALIKEAKSKRAKEYADNLEKRGKLLGFKLPEIIIGPKTVNERRAEAIRNRKDKSDIDKIIEGVKKGSGDGDKKAA